MDSRPLLFTKLQNCRSFKIFVLARTLFTLPLLLIFVDARSTFFPIQVVVGNSNPTNVAARHHHPTTTAPIATTYSTSMSAFFRIADRFVQLLALFRPPIDGIQSVGSVSVEDLGMVWQSIAVQQQQERRFLEYYNNPSSSSSTDDPTTSSTTTSNDHDPSLVITFHGLAASPQDDYEPGIPTFELLLEAADEKGFVLFAPEARPINFFGLFNIPFILGWNDYGRSYLQPDADDVAFVLDMIDYAVDTHGVDRNRVFLAGVSGGGSLVYRLLNEQSDKFAAATALTATYIREDDVPPPTLPYDPTPLLTVIGTRDPFFAFNGGSTVVFDARSLDDTLQFFAEMNGWAGGTISEEAVIDTDACEVSKITYDHPMYPVESFVISGGGHLTPGTDLFALYAPIIRLQFGPLRCLTEFPFVPRMIDFFERYGL